MSTVEFPFHKGTAEIEVSLLELILVNIHFLVILLKGKLAMYFDYISIIFLYIPYSLTAFPITWET